MKKLSIEEVARNIVYDLNKLDNNSSVLSKIAYDYTDRQILVVLKHLNKLENSLKKLKSIV